MTSVFCNPSILRNVPLFSGLQDADLAGMLSGMEHRTYAARSCILRSGEQADGLYVVLSGRVRLLLDDGEGHEIIVATFGPNDFFGEIEVLESAPGQGSFDCPQPTEILQIARKALVEWLERNPAATLSMLRSVIRRLADAHEKIGTLALVNVYGRVARVLLESSHEANGEWLVEPGAEQIASMVGASREMVSRVVKDMINKGIVRRHKRKLIVIDRQLLVEGHCPPTQKKDAVTASSLTSSQSVY
jgi:CRP/FNR family cyclic AMP-dependent transcriptional regulator